MKCLKCGAPIEKDKLFCSECGTEVQLVPDFYSSETVRYARKQKEREQEWRQREAAAILEKEYRSRRRKKRTGIVLFAALALFAAGFTYAAYRGIKNLNSYDYQISRAKTMYADEKFDKALSYAGQAISLRPESLDARNLRAQIYIKKGDTAQVLEELEGVIADAPDNSDAYGILIGFYEIQSKTDEIKELLDSCKSDKIKEMYSDYICDTPSFSIVQGTYKESRELVLRGTKERDTIYYTTDGTEPDKMSSLYSGAIILKEGTVTVKAIAVNEKGIQSEVAGNTYTIVVAPPDPPRITPSSGSYTTALADTHIYVIVPDGCKAYYSFDKPATNKDNLYEGPVDMPEGQHIFYAILVDQAGRSSLLGSATYILTPQEQN